MAVIINELEVVLEAPPAPKQPSAQSATGAQPAQHIQPLDIENIREREARAEYRLLAH